MVYVYRNRTEQQQILSVFDSIAESIYVADPVSHQILYANTHLQKMTGKSLTGGKCHQELHGLFRRPVRSAPTISSVVPAKSRTSGNTMMQ